MLVSPFVSDRALAAKETAKETPKGTQKQAKKRKKPTSLKARLLRYGRRLKNSAKRLSSKTGRTLKRSAKQVGRYSKKLGSKLSKQINRLSQSTTSRIKSALRLKPRFVSKKEDKPPSFGLYWLGQGGAKERYVKGQPNRYYAPNKPTLLFVHGWQWRAIVRGRKQSTYFKEAKLYTHDAWLKKGWNVGTFLWVPFADEKFVTDAEAKIWTAGGKQKMRYRFRDGRFGFRHAPKQSIYELLFQAYTSAMAQHRPNVEIRWAGHSLGNQIVTALAGRLMRAYRKGTLKGTNLFPHRIALLDPYWSKSRKAYLNKRSTADVCFQILQELRERWPSTAIELYNTTPLDKGYIGSANKRLRKISAATYVKLSYLSRISLIRRHTVVRHYYLWSFAFPPPKEWLPAPSLFYGKPQPSGGMALSASTPTHHVLTMMRQPYRWRQLAGSKTTSPQDDSFLRLPFQKTKKPTKSKRKPKSRR